MIDIEDAQAQARALFACRDETVVRELRRKITAIANEWGRVIRHWHSIPDEQEPLIELVGTLDGKAEVFYEGIEGWALVKRVFSQNNGWTVHVTFIDESGRPGQDYLNFISSTSPLVVKGDGWKSEQEKAAAEVHEQAELKAANPYA